MFGFGLLKYKGQIAGVEIQQMTFNNTSSEVESLNEDGDIVQIDQYGRKRTIQGEGNLKSETDMKLEPGAELTVDGITYKLNSVSKAVSNTGVVKISFAGSAPWNTDTRE